MYFIFDIWNKSLSLLIPNNATLFLLVTINAFIKGLKTLFSQLWLFVVIFMTHFLVDHYFLHSITARYLLYSGIILPTIVFIFVLITRASINIKNVSYLRSYVTYWLYFLVGALVLPFLWILFLSLPLPTIIARIIALLLFLHPLMILNPVMIVTLLFFLDQKLSFKNLFVSLVQALRFVFFNYPFVLITYYLFLILFNGIDYVLKYLFNFIIDFQTSFFSQHAVLEELLRFFAQYIVIICYLFMIAFYVNVYLKKIHEDFDLYGSKPSVPLLTFLHTCISRFLLLLLMLVFTIPTIIFLLLPSKYGTQTRLFYWLEYIFCWLLLKIAFVPISIQGWHHLPKDPAIIVANHQSSFDIPVIIYVLRRFPHVWLAIKTLMDSPILRFILPRVTVLVDTSTPMKAMRSLLEVQQIVKGQKSHIIIFPEGGRYADETIHDFFGGYVILAKKMQRLVTPIYIHGLNKVYPPDSFWIHYAKVHVVVGESMMIEENETEAEFNQRVYNWFVSQAQQRS